jgi:hypothetical protein
LKVRVQFLNKKKNNNSAKAEKNETQKRFKRATAQTDLLAGLWAGD